MRAALVVLAFACALLGAPRAAGALTLPPGFDETTVISGLRAPAAVEFAPNGRVFVAEKSGIIKTYEGIADPTATVFADLRTQVHNFSDRGLLSLAIDPDFPAEPYVYVFYVHDAPIGGTAPLWGSPGTTVDPCPDEAAGCVVSGRISRLRAGGEFMSGPETVLVEDFCEQFMTDTGGGLEFGADGYLYMSAGDGAASHAWDWGQFGNPPNPCGDPPGGVGAALTPPVAEGGRLRSQDLRTAGDPTGLAGSLIRIDPDTGAGVPGNPMFSSADPNERRILAYGLRNPYRLAIRPGTNDVWIADRGHGYWSELNRVPSPTDPTRNFGWPCYEGALDDHGNPYARVRPRSDEFDLDICEHLYAEATATTAPYWAYDHELPVVGGEDCRTNSAGDPINTSLSGLEFYPQAGSFPPAYRGALFFGDRWRDCIWALLPGADGLPRSDRVVTFAQRAESPLDLEVGPAGDLYYVDSETETVKRFRFSPIDSNHAPVADARADPVTGNRPVTIRFDGRQSSDPDAGDVLTFAWDLDGDGEFDDSSDEQVSQTYTTGGTKMVALRVTDTFGATATDSATVDVASGPEASIDAPAPPSTWKTGDHVSFSGSATDAEDGALAAAALDWSVALRHCAGDGACHEHELGTFENTDRGAVTAPDHAAPAEIVIRLTATDSSGETSVDTVTLAPQTAPVTLSAGPPGAQLTLNGSEQVTPFTRQVVVGSTNELAAPSQQVVDHTTHRFASWSDARAQRHTFTAAAAGQSFTASYTALSPGTQTVAFPVAADSYVDSSAPATNFGASSALRTDDSPVVQVSYLRFDLAGLTGLDVRAAKLRMRATGNTDDGPAVFGSPSDWREGEITWENRPLPVSGAVADTGPVTAGTSVEWDVTSLVSGDGPVSMLVASAVEDGTQFNSRDVSEANRRPQLIVTLGNDAYARPKSAASVQMPLVTAYAECTAPNAVHGPPLAHSACGPPARSSADLTVGSPDANDSPATAVGSVRYGVRPGDPATAGDEADVAYAFSLTDVRNASDLTDYTGELQARANVRITDRRSGSSEAEPATADTVTLRANVQCLPTAAPGTGSTCALSTTLDALTPGLVPEHARSIWELDQIEVLDGGPDGDADTPDNAVFARQGIFIP